MTTPVLICDDSGFARRQMERSIPDGWDVEISHAENGLQALELIRAGKADVMFLDLNMPVMDGYQTMQAIRDEDLPTMVIVVSGDVQPEARARMIGMGAIDFIRKPIDNDKLIEILNQFGLYAGDASASNRVEAIPHFEMESRDESLDAYREMANVAMGQAGESLAKMLGEFINLPIPNVNLITNNELHMAITDIHGNERVSAVSKGFIGSGINGEALVIFNESNFANMVKLLKYDEANNPESLELEALMDISNILIGACLNALSEQLHVTFSHNHPIILGRHCDLDDILKSNIKKQDKILAIEIAYSIKAQNINFDLLLLFPNQSIDLILHKLVKL
ncbi:response regulator [Paraglaciecola hydrolytica]|uniref:Chemotaxis protein CheC n=1 Tax=Paraglaciecola hydrolytica TaxID=1799789 RepID=A0A135ZZC3_9ALTE|nr:response regulator [Paraglaciecola hydrolytica]KXI28333.1 chemotaxis protein CheC [Paraglaciecola hydrolytica]